MNTLLAALPRTQFKRISAQLEPVSVVFGQVLYERGDVIHHLYFPVDSLVSLLTLVDQHLALEVGMIGREGLVGTALALGVSKSPVRALVQGPGTLLRIKAADFRAEFQRGERLHAEVLHYVQTLMTQIARTAACNRFHVVEARLARWLLMTRDRLQLSEFHLTQDFLADMLGVRRVGVTHAAHALKGRKVIAYSRGAISILDGPGLEAAACSCYGALKLAANSR